MNKSDLIGKMAADAGITKTQAQTALNSFIDGTTGALKSGDKVILVGFGTFSTSKRNGRKHWTSIIWENWGGYQHRREIRWRLVPEQS